MKKTIASITIQIAQAGYSINGSDNNQLSGQPSDVAKIIAGQAKAAGVVAFNLDD